MISKKFAKSYAVLAILVDLCDDENLAVEFYQNGRECGFSVRSEDFQRRVSFAEHRNSDDIVVYTGTNLDFLTEGNAPSEAVKSKYFRWNQYGEAAKYAGIYLQYIDSGV